MAHATCLLIYISRCVTANNSGLYSYVLTNIPVILFD